MHTPEKEAPLSLRIAGFAFVSVAAMFLSACGGRGGGGNDDGDDGDGGWNPPPAPANACSDRSDCVSVNGSALYEFVPAVSGAGGTRLAYELSELRPIRGAEVVLMNAASNTVLDSTVTDANGVFALAAPPETEVVVRVRALLSRAGQPGWEVRVVDNTRNQGVWSAQGEAFTTGSESVSIELVASSGWDGAGYAGSRAAAPFAMLDSAWLAMQRVLEADADAVFPPLKINWSPENRSCNGSSYPFADGCITTSHFGRYGSEGRNIFVLGRENDDTDEFDRHVIIHEWGHYYEDAFARSDSIGGAHTLGDHLDPRVAFGEGWGNAWSGIATDDPVYVDTSGSRQGRGFSFNVEADSAWNPGWWSEASVQRILFDLYDGANDDGMALGFAPLHAALTEAQRQTMALTTIFPLIHFLKQRQPAAASAIDELVLANGIAVISDEWGSGRTALDNTASRNTEAFVVPVYAELVAGTPLELCTTDAYAREVGEYIESNRLGARRFARFTPPSSGSWQVRLQTSAAGGDPDFHVRLRGRTVAAGMDDSAGSGVETLNVNLEGGQTYVIEVMDYINVDDSAASGGNVCLELGVERN